MADKPRKTQLRKLLERPEARTRVQRAVASLLAVGVLAIGAIGVLVIWHLVRRGRLIRDRLPPLRDVKLPVLDASARPKAADQEDSG